MHDDKLKIFALLIYHLLPHINHTVNSGEHLWCFKFQNILLKIILRASGKSSTLTVPLSEIILIPMIFGRDENAYKRKCYRREILSDCFTLFRPIFGRTEVFG